MKHEYEAKFLSIDVDDLQAKLTALGATQVFPRTLLTRKIFENDALDNGQWVRLRDEGTRSTLTLKQVTDPTTIDGTTEIETEVTDLHAMVAMLALAFLTALAAGAAPELPADTNHFIRSRDPITLTVPEIRHLLVAVFAPPAVTVARLLHWSNWRRRHQAAARRSHYRRRSAGEPRDSSPNRRSTNS
jgi:hypothetical protein